MKKKVILISTTLLVLMLSVQFIPLRPVVIIQNNTNNRLYLHADESMYGMEPTPEEVEKMMKARPDIIEPGKTLKLTTSFSSIIKGGYEFNIGWLTGGRYEYNANGGGGQNFLLLSKTGLCSAKLIIKSGYNNYVISDKKEGVCLKKLSPIKDKH